MPDFGDLVTSSVLTDPSIDAAVDYFKAREKDGAESLYQKYSFTQNRKVPTGYSVDLIIDINDHLLEVYHVILWSVSEPTSEMGVRKFWGPLYPASMLLFGDKFDDFTVEAAQSLSKKITTQLIYTGRASYPGLPVKGTFSALVKDPFSGKFGSVRGWTVAWVAEHGHKARKVTRDTKIAPVTISTNPLAITPPEANAKSVEAYLNRLLPSVAAVMAELENVKKQLAALQREYQELALKVTDEEEWGKVVDVVESFRQGK